MPLITVENGKYLNPVATKLILTSEQSVVINLEREEVFSVKQAFCVVKLAEYYLKNKEKYGEPSDYLNYLSGNFNLINIGTLNGVILGTELNARVIGKLKKHIQILNLVEWHRKYGKLKDL